MTIPPLSDEQRSQARKAATQARRRRAEIKPALRAGTCSLADVLAMAERDDVLAHAKVIDVLKALPRVGGVRASGHGAARHRREPSASRAWASTRRQH